MRDDQRPAGHEHPDEEEERFDDALDDLFGPDEDDEETRPRPSGQRPHPSEPRLRPSEQRPGPSGQRPRSSEQRPQPAGGSSPPPRVYQPDTERHAPDERHVLGPDNAPPPPSYDTFERRPETTRVETSTPVVPPRKGRDWRRIACFGCLAAVGLPALCFAILVVIGLVAGDPESEPAAGGVFVKDATSTITGIASPTPAPQDSAAGPVSTIMAGRAPLTIEIDGETGFGTLDKPVPLMIRAVLGDGWELRINSVTENANQIVRDANTFNDPPAAERQFVIANVSATNNTGADSIFDASFRLRLAGWSSGNTYTTFDSADRCGVIPEPVADEALVPGATVTGNVCWQIRTSDSGELVLYNQSFSELDGAIWFELVEDLSAR